MHLYFTTRGAGRFTRRVIEDLQDIYFNLKNKITGKQIGVLQLMPREVKLWECVFPDTEKKNVKNKIREVVKKHAHVTVKFGPFKKDKFQNGIEFL